MSREAELTAQGWTKQVTFDEPRLSDVIEMYEEMDWDIHLEPFDPAGEPGCTKCMQLSPEKYKTTYTRPKA